MAKRKVPHEITLIAYVAEDGGMSITDIVETSRHFAPFFANGMIRNPDITHIAAIAPGAGLSAAKPRPLGKVAMPPNYARSRRLAKVITEPESNFPFSGSF